MDKITYKTDAEIGVMAEGGMKLGWIRQQTAAAVKPGMTTRELDKIAQKLIDESGGEASFKRVAGYHHATCINVNQVVVHGIPGERKLAEGDIVGIDVGLYYKGFHTDAAVTIRVEEPESERAREKEKFLEVGRAALRRAIEQARPGKRIIDISEAMQKTVEGVGYSAVRALTGHGVGRELHEEPAIPCFVVGRKENSPKIVPGMVVAIEVMYNAGVAEVVYENNDGWTIATADGKISGLFEETVAITPGGPVVLTKAKNE
jgi:methionyl aminopeptidase